MQDPQKDTAICVVCDAKPKAKDLYEANTVEEMRTAEPSKDTPKVKRTSDLLGEYLLKGWKMLNKACGTCQTPIMQSKSGEQICVQCDTVTTSNPKEQPQIVEKPFKVKQTEPPVTKLLNDALLDSAKYVRLESLDHPAQCKLILENMHSIVTLLKALEE